MRVNIHECHTPPTSRRAATLPLPPERSSLPGSKCDQSPTVLPSSWSRTQPSTPSANNPCFHLAFDPISKLSLVLLSCPPSLSPSRTFFTSHTSLRVFSRHHSLSLTVRSHLHLDSLDSRFCITNKPKLTLSQCTVISISPSFTSSLVYKSPLLMLNPSAYLAST